MLNPIKNVRRTKDARRIITKAADLFEKEPERWEQGAWIRNEDGITYGEDEYWNASCEIGGICKVCLEGALLIFAKDQDTYEAAEALVVDELNAANPKGQFLGTWRAPYEFNDQTARSAAEIVKVLRGAAKRKARR